MQCGCSKIEAFISDARRDDQLTLICPELRKEE